MTDYRSEKAISVNFGKNYFICIRIFQDTKTGVEYVYTYSEHGSGVTVLLNAYGNPVVSLGEEDI